MESNHGLDLFDTFPMNDPDVNALLNLNSSSNHQYGIGKPINYDAHSSPLRAECPAANNSLFPCLISNDIAWEPIQSQSQTTQTFPHIPGRFETSHFSTKDMSYLTLNDVFQQPLKVLQDELLKQYFGTCPPITQY